MLRRQQFCFSGVAKPVAHYRLPLSEGIVDRTYASLGIQLIRHALKQEPRLYALGMGGFDKPLPQMLKAMGWNLRATPFFFKVNKPANFLKNIQPLRKTPARRVALDFAADSGLGWLALRMLQRPVRTETSSTVESSFLPWADHVWTGCRADYGAIAERDAATLDAFHGGASVIRLKIGEIGWALVLDTQMRGDKYFGDMRLGSIADCLARPSDAGAVMAAATRFLEQKGVDLVVSNQLHPAWVDGLKRCGFREGPSNFIFAASKGLSELIPQGADVHINRGDGDGPIHL